MHLPSLYQYSCFRPVGVCTYISFVAVVRPGRVGPEAVFIALNLQPLDQLLFFRHDFVLSRHIAALSCTSGWVRYKKTGRWSDSVLKLRYRDCVSPRFGYGESSPVAYN